jgi:MSHA pilin protein MshD
MNLHTPPFQRGLTLVEATMAMLLVSILLVAAMRATASSGLIQSKSSRGSTARLLADGMIAEVTALSYEDPDSTPVFGREGGESTMSKATWDDVDDYDGWTESPPQLRDGTPITELAGWERSVTVQRVNASTPGALSVSETGAKLITVTVSYNRLPVATRTAIRTKAP